MDLYSCNGAGFYGGVTGTRETSAEFGHVRATNATTCTLTANTIRSNVISAGALSIDNLITGEVILEAKDAILTPPPPEDCKYGLFYGVDMTSLSPPPPGPYSNIAPVFQDCGNAYTLGNVASESTATFSEPNAIIVSTGSSTGHVVKESKISVSESVLHAIGNEVLRLQTDNNIVFAARSLNVNTNDFTISGSSIFLSSRYSELVESEGGIVVNTLPSSSVMPVSTMGFLYDSSLGGIPSSSYIYVCGDPTTVFTHNDFINVEETPNAMNTGLYQISSLAYDSATNVGTITIAPEGVAEHFVQTSVKTHAYNISSSILTCTPTSTGVVRRITISYFGTDASFPGQLVFKRGNNASAMTTTSYFTVVQPATADVQVTSIADGYSIGVAQPVPASPSTLVIAGKSSYPGINAANTGCTVFGGNDFNLNLDFENYIGITSIGYNAGRQILGDYTVSIGYNAGMANQKSAAIAIGLNAGASTQHTSSIAIGPLAGTSGQFENSVAIGDYAGSLSQGSFSLGSRGRACAIGSYAGYSHQQTKAIAIGAHAGQNDQCELSIAIGYEAGQTNQGALSSSAKGQSIAVGAYAGQTNQKWLAVAVGAYAGNLHQGLQSTAIGPSAGQIEQGDYCIAIGWGAGSQNQQSTSIAIGTEAAQLSQGSASVAIGQFAGFNNQGPDCIAIGSFAGAGNKYPLRQQKAGAVAIGNFTAYYQQETNAIALGGRAGYNQDIGAIAIGYMAATDSVDPEIPPSLQPAGSIAIGTSCQVPSEPNVLAFGGALKPMYTGAAISAANSTPSQTIPATAAGFMHVEYNGSRYCIPMFHAPSLTP